MESPPAGPISLAGNVETGPDKRPQHRNNFNFLRLAMATMVILAHSPELLDGSRRREPLSYLFHWSISLGTIAVDGFFLLSGYLIARSWLGDPQLGQFLKKRVLRIYPGFIMASVVSAFLIGPFAGNPGYLSEFPWVEFLVGVATLDVPQVGAVFAGLPYPMINGSLWTIRYEFLCYLAVAFLGVSGLLRRRYAVLGIYALTHAFFLGQCVTRTLLYKTPYLAVNLALELPAFASFFFAGSCFSLFADRIRYTWRGVLIAAVLLFPAMFKFTTAQAALPILGGYLLFAAAFAPSSLLEGFGRRADISYGVYLYAWPIQSLVIYYHRDINLYLLNTIAIAASYALGFVSWHLVEQPFLRLKKRGAPAKVEATVAALGTS
jgi:peptidoglycan/LPS O-acetylase OafA/YrhL